MNWQKHITGFTLIELMAVMVILGLVAAFSTEFIVSTTKSFVSVSQKNDLLSESRLAIDYVNKRIRNSLPYSVRTINSGQCLEFMPLVSSGLYLEPVPTVINGAFANGNTVPITVSPFVINDGDAENIIIAASSTDELYGFSPGSLAEIQSTSATSVTLTSNKQWLRNSVSQRFYMTDKPEAFCVINGELRLYRNLDVSDVAVNTGSSYDLLSQSVSALGNAFSISSAVEDRNIRLTLSLLFTKADNRLEMIKQVVIRNVP